MRKNKPDFADLSRRRFLQASGLAAGGLLLAACGDGESDATTTTAAAGGGGGEDTTAAPEGPAIPQSELSTVNLDFNTPNINLQAPFWVGQTLGYFEEVGITTINVTENDDPVPPTAAGSIDVALMDATVLFDAEDQSTALGEPLGLRMTSINLGAQPLVMIANEGITAENIAGKIVGGAREGTTNEALAKYILGEIGIDWENDVDFRNLTGGSNDWVTAMLSGQVDATVAFPRHIPLAEEAGGGALFTGSRPDPQAGFGMTLAKMEEAPNLAAAWSHAYIKSQRWCKTEDNWEEMRRIIVEDYGLDYPDNTFSVVDIDAGIMSQDLGFDPAQMEVWLDFMRPLTGMREDIPWRDYMDISGLHVAQAALGLPLNPSADLSTGQELIDNF